MKTRIFARMVFSKNIKGHCFVRRVGKTFVTTDYEDGSFEKKSVDGFIRANSLLGIGYTELLTVPPFGTESISLLTGELREDALKEISLTDFEEEYILRNVSTKKRWEQYQNGKITREKAVEFARKRLEKAVWSKLIEKEVRLRAIEECELPRFIQIGVSFTRTGSAKATVIIDGERYNGSAYGYGYDKASTAIADALNQSNTALNVLLTAKKRELKSGKSDTSKTACSGRCNHNLIGYGSGYSVIPYFEGGVGSTTLVSLFTKNGYMKQYSNINNNEVWTLEKKEVSL